MRRGKNVVRMTGQFGSYSNVLLSGLVLMTILNYFISIPVCGLSFMGFAIWQL